MVKALAAAGPHHDELSAGRRVQQCRGTAASAVVIPGPVPGRVARAAPAGIPASTATVASTAPAPLIMITHLATGWAV